MRRLLKHPLRFAQLLDASKGLCKITDFTQVSVSVPPEGGIRTGGKPMIVTLTLNPAIDKTVVLPGFRAGAVIRIQTLRTDVGGKGVNVSKCLKKLGCASLSVALWGGSTGKQG